MGRTLIKLKEFYLEWSSIIDAPLTFGMGLDELKTYIKDEYGEQGLRDLEVRLVRVEEKGTSEFDAADVVDTIWFNRAGPNERRATIEGIYQHYCLYQSWQEAWLVSEDLANDEDRSHEMYDLVTAGWKSVENIEG